MCLVIKIHEIATLQHCNIATFWEGKWNMGGRYLYKNIFKRRYLYKYL